MNSAVAETAAMWPNKRFLTAAEEANRGSPLR